MLKNLKAPILYVNEMRETVDFYLKHLGFKLVQDNGDFVMLSLGKTHVALNKGDGERKVPGHQTIMLISDSIDQDYEALALSGVNIEMPLTDPGYGKTFILRDPDNNKVEIIE